MALIFKTLTEVADEYLTHLKALKPEVNTDQTDSDWWIRSRVVGGVVSGMYADQLLISNDPFPQSARHDALAKHLVTYFNGTFRSATQTHGNALVTGVIGSTIPVGMEMVYTPNGNAYQASEIVVMAATAELVPVISVGSGQSQNLISGAPLTITSPPAGVDSAASASGDFADARNEESDSEAAARILARIRTPISGGTRTDYLQWAIDADPSVISSNVIRFYAGLGTVAVVVTAGTNDIDNAIDNDFPIVVIPSDVVLAAVSGYIEARKPLTDCVTYLKPTLITQDVTVNVKFTSGDASTILSGQTVSQGELLTREIRRAIYKTPPGGKILGPSGYVVASDIEETIDFALSAGTVEGTLPVLLDRQVQNLSSSGANRGMLATEVVTPGTITIVEM